MIWLPFANVKSNLTTLTDEHVMDVVFEGMQCLRNIYAENISWRDARMWVDGPAGLLFYVVAAEKEMRERGHDPEPRVRKAFVAIARAYESLSPKMPLWYGNPEFHRAQRSHLIRVNPEHYARRMPFTTPLEMPLMWPGEGRLGA